MPKGLMFELQDYLELVDDTGRVIRDNKRGAIKAGTSNILNRLNIPLANWLKVTNEFKYLFKGPVDTLEELTRYSGLWLNNEWLMQVLVSIGLTK